MALQPREKKLIKILAFVAVFSGVGMYFVYNPINSNKGEITIQENGETTLQTTSTPSSPARTPTAPSRSGRVSSGSSSGGSMGVTLSVFNSNNRIESCWVLMKGKVTDITYFLRQFPEYQKDVGELCGGFGFDVFVQENQLLIPLVLEYSTEIGEII